MSRPPLPPKLPRTPAVRVANGLHSAAIHLLRRARVADRETGLSPERLSLLSVLAFAGPRTVGELATAEQVTPAAISRSVKSLESLGLVRRETVASDRRQVLVHATTAGREVMENGRARRVALIATGLAELTTDQLEALERAVQILEHAQQPATAG